MIDTVQLFTEALESCQNHTKWDNAPFGKVKTISNTKVGSVGQLFIEKLCLSLAIPCEFPLGGDGRRLAQSPWDIKIKGIEFELKTATEDVGKAFQFNHIRYHRPYEALLCLGVAPSELYFGVWSKAQVVTGGAGKLVSMEKSANASYKLTKKAAHLIEIAFFEKTINDFTDNFTKS